MVEHTEDEGSLDTELMWLSRSAEGTNEGMQNGSRCSRCYTGSMIGRVGADDVSCTARRGE
jgi:hypothetical protein